MSWDQQDQEDAQGAEHRQAGTCRGRRRKEVEEEDTHSSLVTTMWPLPGH